MGFLRSHGYSALDLLRVAESFDPSLHPRNPKGTPGGGKFRSLSARVSDAIKGGESGVLEKLDRRQLTSVARSHGVDPKGKSDHDVRAAVHAKIASGAEPGKPTRRISDLKAASDHSRQVSPHERAYDDAIERGDREAAIRAAIAYHDARGEKLSLEAMQRLEHEVVAAIKDAKKAPSAKQSPAERAARDKRLIRSYVTGKSLREVADEEGMSASAVHKILTTGGVQLRPRGGSKRTPAKAVAKMTAARG